MLNLIVVGISWPPETFLQRKIGGLHQRGVTVTVATHTPHQNFRSYLPGIEVVRLPHSEDSILLRLLELVRGLILLMKTPQGLKRIRKIWTISSGRAMKVRFSFILQAVSLARFSPDIVHFEW